MPAALVQLWRPALRARGAQVAATFLFALPIPMMAALGLSLPLPPTVERLAAHLVPFGNAGILDARANETLPHGSIVRDTGEQAQISPTARTAAASSKPSRSAMRGSAKRPTSRHATTGRQIPGEPARVDATPTAAGAHDHDSPSSSARGNGSGASNPPATSPATSGGNTSPPPATSTGDSGGDTSSPPPATPTQTQPAALPAPVTAAANTAASAASSVANTVTTAPHAVTSTADSATSAVSSAVGGIKPP